MRIKIPLRLARRSIGLLFAMVLVTAPAVVLAGHQFPDVPGTHPFHNQISANAKAGITTGFGDGGYHPRDAVTRQAMAAFMHRGFGRAGLAVNTAPMNASIAVPAGAYFSSAYVPVRQLTITVPGQTNSFGPNQLVHLQGHVQFYDTMTSSKGCPCEFTATITDITTGLSGPYQAQTFETTYATPFHYSFGVAALLAAPPGPRTYQLMVRLTWRAFTMDAASFDLAGSTSLSAQTFPFGPTGSNTTSAPGAANEPADVDQLPEQRRDE